MVVEPRQSARPGFTKSVRRAGAGHRVAHLVRAFALPTVAARSTLRRPAGPIAPARLATIRILCTAGTITLLGWRFFAAALAKKKILQCCFRQAPSAPTSSDRSGHATGGGAWCLVGRSAWQRLRLFCHATVPQPMHADPECDSRVCRAPANRSPARSFSLPRLMQKNAK